MIVWDPAVIEIARKEKIKFIISTQANVSNWKSAEFYRKLGASRIVLAREMNLKQIKEISKRTGEKVRTYKRKARKLFLNFSKKKQKTRKMIKKSKKEMLQYVRRNLKQLRERLHHIDESARPEIEKLLEIAQRIYEQQYHMYKEKVNKIDERIVSWWREYVRPIKRGKGGRKNVEFGPKVCPIKSNTEKLILIISVILSFPSPSPRIAVIAKSLTYVSPKGVYLKTE